MKQTCLMSATSRTNMSNYATVGHIAETKSAKVITVALMTNIQIQTSKQGLLPI